MYNIIKKMIIRKDGTKMRFITRDTMFFNKEAGTAKAHVVHDSYNRTYYIPRSKVRVIETIEPANEFDIERYIVEIPDWIIRNNFIPVFDMCELVLDR